MQLLNYRLEVSSSVTKGDEPPEDSPWWFIVACVVSVAKPSRLVSLMKWSPVLCLWSLLLPVLCSFSFWTWWNNFPWLSNGALRIHKLISVFMRLMLCVLSSLFSLRQSSVQFETFSSLSLGQAAVVGIVLTECIIYLPSWAGLLALKRFLRTSQKWSTDRNQDVRIASNLWSLPYGLT